MEKKIQIVIEDSVFEAVLNDSSAAEHLWNRLPLEIFMSRWGEEYYGDCGMSLELDKSAREIMEVGEVAFWPPGNALCFFFGPTPVSTDSRPKAASDVIPLGNITGDIGLLKTFGSSVKVSVSRKS